MATPLHVADRVLTDISRATHLVAFLTPVNLAEEEQAFFASSNSEPQFSYRAFGRGAALRTRLEAVNVIERTPLGDLFRNIKEFLLDEVAAGASAEILKVILQSRNLYYHHER